MEKKEREKIKNQAFALALKAFKADEVPVGAVIFDSQTGEVIASAHNKTEHKKDVLAHAEILAIHSASRKLKRKFLDGYSMYVTLEPCVMCAGAIGWSQLGRLVYGASDEKRGFQRFAPEALHPKTEVVSGVLESECAQLMKDFFKQKRSH